MISTKGLEWNVSESSRRVLPCLSILFLRSARRHCHRTSVPGSHRTLYLRPSSQPLLTRPLFPFLLSLPCPYVPLLSSFSRGLGNLLLDPDLYLQSSRTRRGRLDQDLRRRLVVLRHPELKRRAQHHLLIKLFSPRPHRCASSRPSSLVV